MSGMAGHPAFVTANTAAVNAGKQFALRNLGGVAGLPQFRALDGCRNWVEIIKCKQMLNKLAAKRRLLIIHNRAASGACNRGR